MRKPLGPKTLEARNLRFAYPDGIEALADFSFHAAAGEVVTLMGATGSGKTTLLKLLMRLLTPQDGQILLADSDIQNLRPTELYRRLGMVFQNPADQLFGATVAEDVAFGPRNCGFSESEVAHRVEESLATIDVWALRDRPIHQLSYGQQRRVCLAGVLAMEPSILLLDEPTAGLDPVGESQMIELLMQLNRERGVTLIIATHCVDRLPVLADRIVVLSQGRLWQEGSPREIFADAEKVAAAGLRIPLVSQLFHELHQRRGVADGPLPLTIAEAEAEILAWFAENKPAIVREGDGR